jgi:hypothetical protein
MKIDVPFLCLVLLALFAMFSTISSAKNYDVSYNGSVAYITYNNNGKDYATVELLNNLTLGADGKFHFADCGAVMCLAKIQVNASDDIVFNKNNLVSGIIKYNSAPATFNKLYVLQDGSFTPLNLTTTALLARANSSVVFGLEFYRDDLTDTADLIPTLFENEFDRWAWWDAYQPATGTNVVNITACGTYAQNNTRFQMTANLTAALNSSCLTLSGNNNTFNGMWNSITHNQTVFGTYTTGVRLTGNNLTVENLTTTGFFYPLTGTGTNFTLRFINITGITLGAISSESCYSVGNNNQRVSFTSINCGGTTPTYGITSWVGYSGVNLTFTNVNVYSATTGVAPGSTASTWIDGGSNYWATCAGNCTWYSLGTIYQNTSTYDTFSCPGTPTTNYGTSAASVTADNCGGWWHFNITTTPAVAVSDQNISIWAKPHSNTNWIKLNYSGANWTEAGLTYNTRPTSVYSGVQISNFGVGGIWTNNTFVLGAGNTTNINERGGVDVATLYYGLSDTTYDTTARENATGKPSISIRLRPAIYDAPVSASINTNGYNYTIKQALATNGSTYCSFSAPTTSTANLIYNSITLAEVITKYTATLNATHNWITFPCTQNTFYTMEATNAMLVIDSTCGSSYQQIGAFYFADEQTGNNVSGTATMTATSAQIGNQTISLTGTMSSFKLCKHVSAGTFSSRITLAYSNSTSPTRSYYLSINNTTNFTTSPVSLYLLNTSFSSAIRFRLRNQYARGLPDRIQHYLRYNATAGTYTLVAMGLTNDDGDANANLYTNGSTFYKIYSFEPDWDSNLEKTFSQEQVYCLIGQSCDHDLVINEYEGLPTYWADLGDISWSCSWNESARSETCSWADGSGETHDFNLTIYKMSVGNPEVMCSGAETAASGALICEISDANLTGSVYTWRFVRNSETIWLEGGTYDFRDAVFKQVGAVFAFLLLLVAIPIGFFNPAVGVVYAAAALSAANLMGFIELGVPMLMGLWLVALILAYRLGGASSG